MSAAMYFAVANCKANSGFAIPTSPLNCTVLTTSSDSSLLLLNISLNVSLFICPPSQLISLCLLATEVSFLDPQVRLCALQTSRLLFLSDLTFFFLLLVFSLNSNQIQSSS